MIYWKIKYQSLRMSDTKIDRQMYDNSDVLVFKVVRSTQDFYLSPYDNSNISQYLKWFEALRTPDNVLCACDPEHILIMSKFVQEEEITPQCINALRGCCAPRLIGLFCVYIIILTIILQMSQNAGQTLEIDLISVVT